VNYVDATMVMRAKIVKIRLFATEMVKFKMTNAFAKTDIMVNNVNLKNTAVLDEDYNVMVMELVILKMDVLVRTLI